MVPRLRSAGVFETQSSARTHHPTPTGKLGGTSQMLHDLPHSFEFCRRWWVTIRTPQPTTKGGTGSNRGGRPKCRCARDIDIGRHLLDPVDQRSSMSGGAYQEGNGVTPRDLVQERQELVADAIAHEPRVVVRRVGYWNEAELGAEVLGLATPQPDDGMRPARAHRGQTIGTGTASEIDQNGLGLIIGGVAEEGIRAEHGAAAALARASRFAPSPIDTVRDSKAAPNVRAAAATTSASASEPGRRP